MGVWGAEGGPRANAWEKEHGTVNLRVLSHFPRNNTLSHRPGLRTEMRGDSVFISDAAFFKGPLKACWMMSGQRIYWGEMTLNFLRRGVQSYALTCCFPTRIFFSSTWPWLVLNAKINALKFYRRPMNRMRTDIINSCDLVLGLGKNIGFRWMQSSFEQTLPWKPLQRISSCWTRNPKVCLGLYVFAKAGVLKMFWGLGPLIGQKSFQGPSHN